MSGAGGDRLVGREIATGARPLLVLLFVLLLARLLTLGMPPLFDTTEGRYGEIGRAMAASGDWITPMLPGGEPFWAKPPLHFWLTAASIRAFGVNEWAARLPGFLAALATLLLVYRAARSLRAGREEAMLAVVLLGSSLLLVLLSGVVLLDVTFTFAVTGAFASFAALLGGASRRAQGILFFLFLSIGLLAKGPVVLALVFLPILVWAAAKKRGGALRSLPWGPGVALLLVVVAPWFVLAERKTPGFCNYFFIHEHILRYLQSDYGDRYGHGHVSPHGLVWVLAFVAFLPWSPAVIGALRRSWRARRDEGATDDGTALLLSWALLPLLFFTFSRSLSLPYVLPSLPPLALLLARDAAAGGFARLIPGWGFFLSPVLLLAGAVYGLGTFGGMGGRGLAIPVLAALLLAAAAAAWRRGARLRMAVQVAIFPLFLATLALALPGGVEEGKSTRHLRNWVRENSAPPPDEVFFFDGPPLSASFYFGGKARDLRGEEEEIRRLGGNGGEAVLFVREDRAKRLGDDSLSLLSQEGKSGRYLVFRVRSKGGRS